MNILYYVPHLNTVYANRTIIEGYKNAFLALGHNFRFLTANDSQISVVEEFAPHIFFTSMNSYVLKFLNFDGVKKMKQNGTKIFVNTPFWTSPFSSLRLNETPGLKTNAEYVDLITSGNFGDVYYTVSEQGDPRMEGFQEATGYPYYTIPLAADKTKHYYDFSNKFDCDISFLGTFLPEKRAFIKNHVFPLREKYKVMLLGQDWTSYDRLMGWVSRFGKYFNLPVVKDIQKPTLGLDDERRIYSSSKISLNIHEEYQREFGKDCNERTFKIPACGGFEVSDYVECIGKYFVQEKEIVMAKTPQEWREKIDYYMKHPEERRAISEAGRLRVLADHTYHNRAQRFVDIYTDIGKA